METLERWEGPGRDTSDQEAILGWLGAAKRQVSSGRAFLRAGVRRVQRFMLQRPC